MPTLRERAEALKEKSQVLLLAVSHPRTPWYAKACGLLTLLYLLAPIDLIPDFIPVLGYADDAIVAFVLRTVVSSAGKEKLEEHWPGTPSGLAAVERLARISRAAHATDHASRGKAR